jgi:hypothetical protein
VVTRLGTRYVFPDMTNEQVDVFRRGLDQKPAELTLRNVSGVITVFPKRIIAYAGVNNRTFWEAPCPSELNPESRDKES